MASAFYKSAYELFLAVSKPMSFATLLTAAGTIEVDKFDYNGFNLFAILDVLKKCAEAKKISKEEFFKDLADMVLVRLTRGNIRQDQLGKTVEKGGDRIKYLSETYNIPLRKSAKEKTMLQQNTMTFTLMVTCFPHVVSLFLMKAKELVKEGTSSDLKSQELPSAMKHSGFAGLIPNGGVDENLQSVYLLAHTAYMIDFGHKINPANAKKSIAELYQSQMNYAKIAIEKSCYTDDIRIGYLRAIVAVAFRLQKAIGRSEIGAAPLESKFAKNNVICYLEDEDKEKLLAKDATDLQSKVALKRSETKAQATEQIQSGQTLTKIQL